MDAELRALVHRLAADPSDLGAGAALARAVLRSRPVASELEPVPVPAELAGGSAVLVLRPARPRLGFAWRGFMDRAVGRVGWVRAIAADRLTAEVFVPEVGVFQAGAASLLALPEVAPQRVPDVPAPPAQGGRSIADLRRVANAMVEDAPGRLGDDGLTATQRDLLAAIPANEPLPIARLADLAGFTRENNRETASAVAVLFGMAEQNPRVRCPLVTVETPVLLPGDVVSGPLDTGPWTLEDLFVARLAGSHSLTDGLPWAALAGARHGEVEAPPHDPGELADALVKLLESRTAGLDEVLAFLPGPDFPGGGEVAGREAVRALYETGSGTLRLRPSIEFELPARLVVRTPWPEDAAEVLSQVVSDSVRARRLDGVAALSGGAELRVELERGADTAALHRVKEALEGLLPEQEVAFRLPAPLAQWLRAFIAEKRRTGATDRAIRRQILAARTAVAAEVGRRTRIV